MKSGIKLGVVFFIILNMLGCTNHVQKQKSPNFIVLISDDQRWDQLSYMDNPLIPELKTPNLDNLASDGIYFKNGFVTTPICAVSRASIMTGMYASSHGMNHFNTPIEENVLKLTYPALLHENGYRTGVLGKWGMGIDGTEEIFDLFNAWAKQGVYYHDTDSGKIHNSEWLAIKTREFLKTSSSDQPFCLTVCYKSPHHPYQPDERDKDAFANTSIPKRETDTPEDYQNMASHVMDSSLNRWCYFDERRDEETKDDFEKNFLRCVKSLDRSVGNILQSLKELELDENTYVIFLSDNGYLWGEHGLGGKWLLYEESIRVPVIIKGPGIPESMQGSKTENFALNIDIAPTILDLAGIAIPQEMDGVSLVHNLKENTTETRSDFFMEHVGIIEVKNPIPDSRGVRTHDWKYIRYVNVEPEVEEMYHLKKDPLEANNLINDPNFEDVKNQLIEKYTWYINHLQDE